MSVKIMHTSNSYLFWNNDWKPLLAISKKSLPKLLCGEYTITVKKDSNGKYQLWKKRASRSSPIMMSWNKKTSYELCVIGFFTHVNNGVGVYMDLPNKRSTKYNVTFRKVSVL